LQYQAITCTIKKILNIAEPILGAVHRAYKALPRGAFFIVTTKNE